MRWRGRLVFLRLVLLLGIAILLGAGLGGYCWYDYSTPASAEENSRLFTVLPGLPVRQIARRLQEAGLIRHRQTFVLYAMLSQKAARLQAGEYLLSPGMSPAEILDLLYHGKVAQYPLTIPEGSTLQDIATLITAQGFGTVQDVLSAATDRAFIASLDLEVASLEGYLFPETYHFSRGTRVRTILSTMVRTFHERYTEAIASQARALGLSRHQVLTLASLIEKEARVARERALIAAVFHNRLRRGMRLQCDSTVIYALGRLFDGNLRKADLDYDSPYNTYRYAGLPPGPIASPGSLSLQAAVEPAAVDYLYFVATRENGTHHFSVTLHEHNRAVQRYQLGAHSQP